MVSHVHVCVQGLLAESGLLRLEEPGLKQIEMRLHLMLLGAMTLCIAELLRHDLPLHAAARGEPVSFTDELKVADLVAVVKIRR